MKIAFIVLWVVLLVIIEVAPLVREKFKRSDNDASLYK